MATHDKPNFLVIISDEHRRDAMGCMGHTIVTTPHLDALAARGTLFTNAYTASPMCVPTRAALATGHYVNRNGFWDSATPYDGSVKSWMHRVRDSGCEMVSIGKLHFRDGSDDNGFSREILPMHVVGGVGWAVGLLRKTPPEYDVAAELAADSGRGETSYTAYDRAITNAATEWISDPERLKQPWAAFVSLVSPHYPLSAPDAFYDAYAGTDFDLTPDRLPDHPEVRNLANFFDYDRHFTPASRQAAMAGYFGLTSFMDDCVGQILTALADSGQTDNTVVIYLSDHGEMLGEKGLWTKQVMYEASAGIPVIMAGPNVPKAHLCRTAVSLVDVAATAHEVMLDQSPTGQDGTSLRTVARSADDPERAVLSEYHDGGSSTGAFMIRWQRWKYVHYVDMPPQLFDLESDPVERTDLGTDPAHLQVRDEALKRLHEFCDPDAVNTRCFADQARRIETLGGVDACRDAYVFNHTPTPEEQSAMEAEMSDNIPMAAGAAWMDGRVMPISDARMQVNDWGLVHSDITYDVVPVWDGGFFRLDDYLARFDASRASLRLDIGMDEDAIRSALHEMVAASGLRQAYVAMVASRGVPLIPGTRDPRQCGNHFYAWCVPYIHVMKPDLPPESRTAWIAQSVTRIPEGSIDPRVKNYHWGDFTAGLFEAKDKGFETVILLDSDGHVTEGPGFNVFAVRGNRLVTSDHGMLEGISRRTVLEMAEEQGLKTEIRPLPLQEFLDADEVFLSTSGGGVVPLTRVNDRVYQNGGIGPVTSALHTRYWQWVHDPVYRTEIDYK